MAAGCSNRAIKFLAASDEKLLPGDRGIRDLKRVAIIGGFMRAGLPLLTAARLAKVVLYEFNENDGEAFSGLDRLARYLPDVIATLPSDAAATNDFHYHRALLTQPALYTKGKALRDDALVEIVDSTIVFLGSGIFPANDLIGWIEGLGRGEEAKIIYITEVIGKCADAENQGWRERADKLEAEARDQRENAIARTIINISLAIRSALDRVAEHRGYNAEERSGLEAAQ